MPFINAKDTLGFKLEGTAYTKETLAATDYDVPIYNIAHTPEIENAIRAYSVGDYSKVSAIMGKKMKVVSFSVDMAYSGAAATAPAWGKMLKACSYKETVHGATGVSYVTNADYCSVPATIETQKMNDTSSNALLMVASGCMGKVTFNVDNIGAVLRMDFEFSGTLYTIEDRSSGSILTPTGFDATDPDPVIESTLTAFGVAQAINAVTIDGGEVVELFVDPAKDTGYRGAYVVDRSPTISLDPYLELAATDPWFARWSGGTTGGFAMTVGDNLTLIATAIQAGTAFPSGDRGGFSSNAISGFLTRNAGNDELKILQGSES